MNAIRPMGRAAGVGPRRLRLTRRLPCLVAGLLAAFPPAADAFAEPGTKLDPVDLPALAGGKAPFFSRSVKANVFLFYRPGHERSLDALRQITACEKDLASRSVRWVIIVSGTAPAAEVKAEVAASGTRMPVLVDEGDKLYQALQVRTLPAVGVADGGGVLRAMEPYRQLDFTDIVKAHVLFTVGEIDRAALDRALHPEGSPLPGGDLVEKSMRDVNMARRLLELGQVDAAVKQAQRALEQAPVPAAFAVLALGYARQGRCPEAGRMLDQAQRVAPESAEIPEARKLCPAR
jgi:tetratricopeptide (TPR) repeat protein